MQGETIKGLEVHLGPVEKVEGTDRETGQSYVRYTARGVLCSGFLREGCQCTVGEDHAPGVYAILVAAIATNEFGRISMRISGRSLVRVGDLPKESAQFLGVGL